MNTKETLQTEAEARRAVAERRASHRYGVAIARYLAAFEYTAQELKERDEQYQRAHQGDKAEDRDQATAT